MAQEEVQVFGFSANPLSRRVEMALKIKGVSYEFMDEDVSNKSPLLLQYNPIHKKIPVLLHNGKPIVESLDILEYIDETWKGNPILPEDPYDKAMARFWAKFLDEKCLPTVWKAVASKGEEREKAKGEACEYLKTLEGVIGDKKFFGGDTVGIVDIAANSIAYWLRPVQEIVGIEILSPEGFPALVKWSEEFVECPIIKESLPSRDELMAFFMGHMERNK